MNRDCSVDSAAALHFLQRAFEHEDWLAVFVKRDRPFRVAQRVAPLSVVATEQFQAWLRRENREGANVYVSVNALRGRAAERRRYTVGAIRHVFIDSDRELEAVLAAIDRRRELPPPSYVIRTSADRGHVLWRAVGFTAGHVEALEKRLSRELQTDSATTACSQLTRLPGCLNHKRSPAFRVTVDYGVDADVRYGPADFPRSAPRPGEERRLVQRPSPIGGDAIERVRRYLAVVPAAVSGQQGDVHTFRVCCRIVRGFALSDADALRALADWNTRCEPPWSERELIEKLRRARRYGREPIGGLLGAQR